jgi:hypothetical protein
LLPTLDAGNPSGSFSKGDAIEFGVQGAAEMEKIVAIEILI